MRVTIFGSGYVGLVQGTVLAEAGHSVVCVDVDQVKVATLNKGIASIYEPGLEPMMKKNIKSGNLSFTADSKGGVTHGEILFIAVGTPPGEDGSADLQYVTSVAKTIAEYMKDYKVIVNKSTVPVGTADKVTELIRDELARLGKDISFDVVSNPEFLKEGAAVSDCTTPSRVIIGTDSSRAANKMRELYGFCLNETELVMMDTRSTELTKYAANCMLASKISFMNEIANLAELLGADVESVRIGIGLDPRIGFQFINPGCGYGGSCFPKDVRALIRTAQEIGYNARMLKAIEEVNRDQKEKLFSLIERHYDGDLAGRTFALWGLAFKPETDDMREAPSLTLLKRLCESGAAVRAFDPAAMPTIKSLCGNTDRLELTKTKEDALRGADALIICTEWGEFKKVPLEKIKADIGTPVIFDGRNIYDAGKADELGIIYYGIGRGRSVRRPS